MQRRYGAISSVDWKLSFLREFADFLQRWDWEATGNGGLTRETFLALRHTWLTALPISLTTLALSSNCRRPVTKTLFSTLAAL